MKIGISDIGIFVPRYTVEIRDIIEKRLDLTPKMKRKIEGSSTLTGQKSIRFSAAWEDPVTLAAEAFKKIIDRNPSITDNMRFLGVGTETEVDYSKPVAAYLQGLLINSGIKVPGSISSFQTRHACASGTIAMMNIASQLALSSNERETGIAVCSDIAHYERNSTAEITQGAGAAALFIERNPSLVELDLSSQGYASSDVDDFFRPLGSKTPRVKGQYSMKCYQDALINAFDDYCRKMGRKPEDVLDDVDYFVCHSPFAAMPKMALRYLLEERKGLDFQHADEFIKSRAADSAYDYVSSIGNLYSGALYLSLAALLYSECQALGEKIIGKNILFASYGSGNTMIVFSGKIAEKAPAIIDSWNFPLIFADSIKADFNFYEDWMSSEYIIPSGKVIVRPDDVPSGRYYLSSIRIDGYRQYGYKE